MAGHPDAAALIAAVRDFLGGLTLDGRDAFHAKVAGNVLAIVERELAARPEAAEAAALYPFGRHPRVRGDDGEGSEADALRADICVRIRAGDLTLATPGLLDALVAANVARLAVDNPRYSTFARRAGGAALSSLVTPAAAPQR